MRTAGVIGTATAFFPRFPPDRAGRAVSAFRLWLDRQRQRVALSRLDDRLLDDIGVSREAAERECARWD